MLDLADKFSHFFLLMGIFGKYKLIIFSDNHIMFSVLRFVGIGAFSAREAEGRSNISSGEAFPNFGF